MTPPPTPPTLDDLRDAVRTVEDRTAVTDRRVRTGWLPVDRTLGSGLRRGCLHEWHGSGSDDPGGGEGSDWLPPLYLFGHLAQQAIGDHHGLVVWIGTRCHPQPPVLSGQGPTADRLLRRSLFVNPATDADRLWAVDQAARNPAVAAVVADAAGLDLRAGRRLQLAAEQAAALVLLARPPDEHNRPTAAWSRWWITPEPSPNPSPRWTVALTRCKGLRPTAPDHRRWTLEWNHDACAVRPRSPVADRTSPTTPNIIPRHKRRIA